MLLQYIAGHGDRVRQQLSHYLRLVGKLVSSPLQLLLVERELLQRRDLAVVVLSAPANQLLGDCSTDKGAERAKGEEN